MLKEKAKNQKSREKRVFFTNFAVLNSKIKRNIRYNLSKTQTKKRHFVIFTNIFPKIPKNPLKKHGASLNLTFFTIFEKNQFFKQTRVSATSLSQNPTQNRLIFAQNLWFFTTFIVNFKNILFLPCFLSLFLCFLSFIAKILSLDKRLLAPKLIN